MVEAARLLVDPERPARIAAARALAASANPEVGEPLLKPLYDLHSFEILPRLGQLFAGDAASYRYLAESIRKHPNQEALRQLMQDAGFERVEYRNLSAGIVAIHTGIRA